MLHVLPLAFHGDGQGQAEFARAHGLPLCLCSGAKGRRAWISGAWGSESEREHSSEPGIPRHTDEANKSRVEL